MGSLGDLQMGFGAAALVDDSRYKQREARAEQDMLAALAEKRLEQMHRERDFQERKRTNDSLVSAREASERKADAAAKRAEDRTAGMAALISDPSRLASMTPLQRLLAVNQLGVANVGLHDLEDGKEHGAHQAGERDAKFNEWKRQYDYQNQNPRPSTAADPVARVKGRLMMDDPSFPRGVQSYMSQLRTKYQDFDQAQAEFSRALPDLQRDHPSLAPMKALNALRQQYSGGGNQNDNDALLDELLSGDGQGGAGTGAGPGGAVRIRGARGGASSSGQPGAAAPSAPKGGGSVTMQELQMLATKRGTSVEQEKQRASAAGFNIR